MTRMHVQKARTRAAPKIFVTAAHSEVDIHRRDVDRKNAERMIDIEQQLSAGSMRCRNDLCNVAKSLSRIEKDFRNDDEVDRLHDRSDNVPRVEPAIFAGLDQVQPDATPPRVYAQDHDERIELAPRRDDSRHIVVTIEHRA